MRTFICAVLAGCACALYGAATQGDWAGTFFTVGPDRYADGSVVRDGEYYAIVWRDASVPFAGFRGDVSLAGKGAVREKDALVADTAHSQLIAALPWAKDGRLVKCAYTFPSADYAAYAKGCFSVYLLDTRRYGAVAAGAQTAEVLPGSGTVQGFAEVAGFVSGTAAFGSSVSGASDGSGFLLSTLDQTTVPNPVIRGIRVEGDEIVLTVAATSAQIAYNVAGGETVGGPAAVRGVAPVTGAATEEKTIEIRVRRDPAKSAEFFNVIRNPMKQGEEAK